MRNKSTPTKALQLNRELRHYRAQAIKAKPLQAHYALGFVDGIEKTLNNSGVVLELHYDLLSAIQNMDYAFEPKHSSSLNRYDKSYKVKARACRRVQKAARKFLDEIGVTITAKQICETSECDGNPIAKKGDAICIEFGNKLIDGTRGECTPSDKRFGFVKEVLDEWSTTSEHGLRYRCGVNAIVLFDDGAKETVSLDGAKKS